MHITNTKQHTLLSVSVVQKPLQTPGVLTQAEDGICKALKRATKYINDKRFVFLCETNNFLHVSLFQRWHYKRVLTNKRIKLATCHLHISAFSAGNSYEQEQKT